MRLAREYLALEREFPAPRVCFVRGHLFKLLHEALMRPEHAPLRAALVTAETSAECGAVVEALGARGWDGPAQVDAPADGWYRRHRVRKANAEERERADDALGLGRGACQAAAACADEDDTNECGLLGDMFGGDE